MSSCRISAVLATDAWATAADAVECLRRQTIAGDVELVLVGPRLELPPDAGTRFRDVAVVDDSLESLAEARAEGISRASGDVVFVAETHGFPKPDCLERLCDAFGDDVVAAMPRLTNANPRTARSWASLFATYAAFTGSDPRPAPYVPLHNCAFRRDFLADVAAVPADLVYGVGISAEIAQRRLRAAYVPAAEVDHLNVDLPAGMVQDRFAGARMWAALRSRAWSPGRRAFYVAAAPAAAAVAATRVLRTPGWDECAGLRPRGTPALVVGIALVQAAGEALGYATGIGNAESRHLRLEIHRRAYTT